MDAKLLISIICFINLIMWFYLLEYVRILHRKTIDTMAKSEQWQMDTYNQSVDLFQSMATVMSNFINDLNDCIEICSEEDECQNTEQSEQR